MAKVAKIKTVIAQLHERFDQICSDISMFAVDGNENHLRELVDERRYIHASLIDYQSQPETTSNFYEPTVSFLNNWTMRIFAFRQQDEINEFLWDPEYCHVYLDCFIPLIWNWERDWLVLIEPSTEMLIATALDRGQKYILIFDPDADSKEYDLFASDKVIIARNLEEVRKCFNLHAYPILRVKGIFCGENLPAEKARVEINDIIKKAITKHHLNLNTAKLLTSTWIENFIENSRKLSELPHISEVEMEGIDAAVIVAPGPSLNKNIHALKAFKGRALIICVLHALPRLLKENITPDVVIHIDSKPDEQLIEHLKEKLKNEIPLLIVSTNLPQHYRELPHKNIVWTEVSGSIHFELCKFLNIQFPHLSGGNVSLYAFNLCAAWNIENIILIGQDLSYLDSQFYADTAGLANAINIKKHSVNTEAVEVDGYYGGLVKTSNDFSFFIEQFTMWSRTSLHKNSKLFNCTEGGAKIEGFENIPLIKMLEILPRRNAGIEFSFNFTEQRKNEVKELFKKYFCNYLDKSKTFLEQTNICEKISAAKNPSQKQTEKRKQAEIELKRISQENKLLESYLVGLVTETNSGNSGILNTITSAEFYNKLRKEVIRFRSHLINFID